MRIRNFIAAYSVDEDRILLEICGSSGGHHFWLTRRALQVFNQAVDQVLKTQYHMLSLAALSPGNADALAHFGQASAVERFQVCDHEKPFQLDQDALLVFEIGYQVINHSLCKLKLSSKDGKGFQYQLSRDVLHALMNLLEEQLKHAHWGLSMSSETQKLAQMQPTLNSDHVLH